MGIGADELPDLINEKDDAVVFSPAIEIVLDPLAEVLDGQGKIVLSAINPFFTRLFALAEGMGQCLDDLVPIERVGVAFVNPAGAGQCPIGIVKDPQPALAFKITLHVGDMRVVATVACQLVQYFEEHRQEGIAPGPIVRLAVDIEQNDIGMGCDRALDVPEQHRVLDFSIEEFDGLPGLTIMRMTLVIEQVGQYFDEVGFAGSKKTRNPDPDLPRNIRVPGLVHRFAVAGEEAPKVLVQFLRDNELLQLLPDR